MGNLAEISSRCYALSAKASEGGARRVESRPSEPPFEAPFPGSDRP